MVKLDTVTNHLRESVERELGFPIDDPVHRQIWQSRQGFEPESVAARHVIYNAQLRGDKTVIKSYFDKKVKDGD